MQRTTLKILGTVQGVGFRAACKREAQRVGLVGYVQNLIDGSVELVAEGKEEDLKKFIDWCYTGNGLAIVQKITTRWSDPTSEFSVFLIRY